ncbi:mitochondrial inner membrane protease subunit 2 isoform X1 [Lepisosteus oculatus]|uniref:mitochondrial inner membrane protease subunit 2 isoform X1 n=1 Tax=Lepisosteus oculatus TaxID=7918 RepID=UPI0007404226|nr:PREDICTED: mitochondrial inner membrane protease subunit 2 isoform X1 [Lepisosteus oculatus]
MAQMGGFGRRYIKAFVSGFFIAVPVTVTVLDRLAYVARVEGASMQPSLNPEGGTTSDIVLLNRWSVRHYQVQRGDIVSVVSPKNPQQKIIKRVIALEGDIIKTMGYKNRYLKIPDGHFWIEGDHHGHSLDSNNFGPLGSFLCWIAELLEHNDTCDPDEFCTSVMNKVSLGLVHARASHIIWPPNRWQKIQTCLPADRTPVLSWNEASRDDNDE